MSIFSQTAATGGSDGATRAGGELLRFHKLFANEVRIAVHTLLLEAVVAAMVNTHYIEWNSVWTLLLLRSGGRLVG